jgi:hypothetical protein
VKHPFKKRKDMENKYTFGINCQITTVNNKGLFKAKNSYCEVKTPSKDIDTKSVHLISMLMQFFQPQFKSRIFLLKIKDCNLIQPDTEVY